MKSNDTKEPEDYKDFMTVGSLLDFIEKYKLSRESKVLIQRIEDIYFDKYNWETFKKEGFMYNMEKEKIQEIKKQPEEYPLITPKDLQLMEESLPILLEEYVIAFSPVKYKNDNHLYLDAHY